MKKKVLLPIVLLAAMTLVGCGGNNSSSNSGSQSQTTSSQPAVEYGVAIQNKAALTAEWYAKEASRELDIALTPEGNVLQEVANGNLTITSSNPEAVSVTGVTLNALDEGEATITVDYHGKTDSVTISVLGEKGEPDHVKATVKEMLANVAAGKEKDVIYEIEAYVVAWQTGKTDATKYGNYMLGDTKDAAKEDQILVYGSSANTAAFTITWDGAAYSYKQGDDAKDFLTNDVTKDVGIGSKLTMEVIAYSYSGTPEVSGIVKAADNSGVTPLDPIQEYDVTVAEALAKVATLKDGETTRDLYTVKEVYVTEITEAYSSYGNMSFKVADTADGTDTLTIFRAKTSEENAAKVVVGAQVTVQGNLQKYVKDDVTTPELTGATSIKVKQEVNYGTLEAPLTVTNLLDDDGSICEKTQGAFSDKKVVVKGVLKEATYSSSYGTYSGVLQDTEDATKTIKFTGVKLDESVAAHVAGNDTVILEHYLEYYNNAYALYYKKSNDVYDYGDILSRVAVGTSTVTVEVEHATVQGLEETYQNDETATFYVVVDSGYELVSVKVYGKTLSELKTAGPAFSFTVLGNATVTITTQEAGAVASDITWDGSEDGSTANLPAAYSEELQETSWEMSFGTETLQMNGANVKASNGYVMMGSKEKKATAFIFNTTAVSRAIAKIEITTGAKASNSAKYHVSFGTSALSTATTEEGTNVAQGTAQEFTCNVEGATYFQIASTATGYNGQVAKIVVTFVEA